MYTSITARKPTPIALPAASPVTVAVGMAAFALVVRLLLLPGFGGTDDVIYALRGTEIAQGIWRPGAHIGELRYGINLPIALFAALFGTSTLSLTGWSLLSSVAEVGLVAWFAARLWGSRAGLAAGFVLAVTPLHIELGGRTLADAPLAMFTTLAFIAFAIAERNRSKLGYLVSGLACGACWWIKPTVAVPLYLAMALYVAVVRRLDVRWLYTVLGCAVMIAAELVFLSAISNNPFSTLKALLPFVGDHRQYRGDPMWGSNSPWFYFRRMFVDGRDMWLVPFVAAGGAAVLARGLATSQRPYGVAANDRFVLFWITTLLGVFSFFVFSINPVRFIPKQENYASIFLAPLALLAAAALVRLPKPARLLLIVVLAAGGFTLAGLVQQTHRYKYSRMTQALEFAYAYPDATVLMSAQTVVLGQLRQLTGQARTRNFEPWSAIDDFVNTSITEKSKPLFGVLEPSSPEQSNNILWNKISHLAECAQPFRELNANPSGAGIAAVQLVARLLPELPSAVSQQLSFAKPIINPPVARVLMVPAACRMPAEPK